MAVGKLKRSEALARLTAQIEKIVEEADTGEPFDVQQWLKEWLVEPVPCLGGRAPSELLGTRDGVELVSHTIAQFQSGAYA